MGCREVNNPIHFTGAERREWMGMGLAGIIIDGYEMDHSRIPC